MQLTPIFFKVERRREGRHKLYPKEEEVKKLQSAIQQFGIFDFKEAREKLECHQVEGFLLSILSSESDLKWKAETLEIILELGP